MSTWDSTRGNGLKFQQGRFALSISQNHLSRTVEGRTEVLGEAPFLEVHRSQLAEAAVAQGMLILPQGRGMHRMPFQGPRSASFSVVMRSYHNILHSWAV